MVEALAIKSDDLSSIPGTHIVEAESRLLKDVHLTSSWVLWHLCMCAHIRKQRNVTKIRTEIRVLAGSQRMKRFCSVLRC